MLENFYGFQNNFCANHKQLHATGSLLHIVHLIYEVFTLSCTGNLMIQRCSILGVTMSDAMSCCLQRTEPGRMATCQAVSAVLPPTLHRIILFNRCPHLPGGGKIHVNVDLPSYKAVLRRLASGSLPRRPRLEPRQDYFIIVVNKVALE
jgi:hypothetical protein